MVNTFNTNDYTSSDGMITMVWGPMVWHFLHIISFNYPINPTKEQKNDYKNYLLYLGKVLPCKYCRDNFATNLKKAGFSNKVLKNRDTFSKFIYKLHNSVNKMLNKSTYETFVFVRDRYEMFRARCVNDTPVLPRTTENGCLTPLYGTRSKTIISIVPVNSKKEGFHIDKKCLIKRRKSSKRRSRSRSRKK